jgi:hypothetical protein
VKKKMASHAIARTPVKRTQLSIGTKKNRFRKRVQEWVQKRERLAAVAARKAASAREQFAQLEEKEEGGEKIHRDYLAMRKAEEKGSLRGQELRLVDQRITGRDDAFTRMEKRVKRTRRRSRGAKIKAMLARGVGKIVGKPR